MKQIKKQVLMVLCMAACLFSLSACSGAADEADTVDPMISSGLQQQTVLLLENITSIPADQMTEVIEQNRKNDSEAVAAGLEGYVGVQDDLGAYVSSGEAAVKATDDGYQVTIDAVFEKRACSFVLELDEEMVNITGMSFNPVYTTGENMSKAAMNTLMGMGTVFLVLIFISLLIGCFKYIGAAEQKMKGKKAAPAPAAPAPAAVPAAEENLADDLELVAVITAAIAAAEGTSSDGLVVRSIRRAPGNKWKRA